MTLWQKFWHHRTLTRTSIEISVAIVLWILHLKLSYPPTFDVKIPSPSTTVIILRAAIALNFFYSFLHYMQYWLLHRMMQDFFLTYFPCKKSTDLLLVASSYLFSLFAFMSVIFDVILENFPLEKNNLDRNHTIICLLFWILSSLVFTSSHVLAPMTTFISRLLIFIMNTPSLVFLATGIYLLYMILLVQLPDFLISLLDLYGPYSFKIVVLRFFIISTFTVSTGVFLLMINTGIVLIVIGAILFWGLYELLQIIFCYFENKEDIDLWVNRSVIVCWMLVHLFVHAVAICSYYQVVLCVEYYRESVPKMGLPKTAMNITHKQIVRYMIGFGEKIEMIKLNIKRIMNNNKCSLCGKNFRESMKIVFDPSLYNNRKRWFEMFHLTCYVEWIRNCQMFSKMKLAGN